MAPLDAEVIVVGARAAGAATAMLLARAGVDVVVVDRASYGTDTVSTHALMRAGVLQLSRWGLLEDVKAASTPRVTRTVFHYPDGEVPVDIVPQPGVDGLYAPRRTVLDPLLVDAARQAGARFAFGTTVRDLLRDGDGRVVGITGHDGDREPVEANAGLVVGADGIRSVVARVVQADTVWEGTHRGAAMYGYFGADPKDTYDWHYAPGGAAGLIPTNDDSVIAFCSITAARWDSYENDTRAALEAVLAELAAGWRESLRDPGEDPPLRAFRSPTSFLRQAHGPGWALVGDAGSFKDPIGAHGLTDAFRDAELLARAVLSDQPRPEAMAEYQRVRDELTIPLADVTDRIAGYDWTLDRGKELLLELARAMNPELDVIAGFDAPTGLSGQTMPTK